MKPNIQRDVPQLERSVPRTGDDLVLVNFTPCEVVQSVLRIESGVLWVYLFSLISYRIGAATYCLCGMSPEAKLGSTERMFSLPFPIKP